MCVAAMQLEMVDPGTVLMWIFGSILALLWLLFVCYGKPHRQPGGFGPSVIKCHCKTGS